MKVITAGLLILLFAQCKKSSPGTPPATDSTARLAEGRYLFRTQYVKCGADSIAFALGLFSNYETIGFRSFTKQELPDMKEAEDFIWHLQPVYQYIAFDPNKRPEEYGLLGYRIYKVFPDGVSCYFIGMIRPSNGQNDISDDSGPNQRLQRIPIDEVPTQLIGIGEPLSFPPGYNENNHPGHFDEFSAIFDLNRTASGNFKLLNNRREHVFHNWGTAWKLTTTNNWANNICDRAQIPLWRPNGNTPCNFVNEDNDNFRRCYIDEFNFEKVD
ncbi:hypothetical protein [Chitinophaga niabensis]|uniref:Uncharacterized protein n=1 Tax=Chitinophaga niabensis TaxID=536979 RepID=A0A1N6F1H1_9BACT|nr:hypothetical protein [Chitinophaga niabensis]SIN89089.1 hypothetical protein SAMN04488055_1956 [Chitinophaga niabensis]